jgi:hypothetical protein
MRLVAYYLYISVHIECEITLRKRVYEANLGGVEADWKIWKQIRFSVELWNMPQLDTFVPGFAPCSGKVDPHMLSSQWKDLRHVVTELRSCCTQSLLATSPSR